MVKNAKKRSARVASRADISVTNGSINKRGDKHGCVEKCAD